MHIRKFYDIADMNRVGMFDHRLISLADETLLIVGDRGYPDYFRVEIKFFATEYIACPRYFTEPIRWRMASEEEATRIFQAYINYPSYIARPVYCIEEDMASYIPPADATQKSREMSLQYLASRHDKKPLAFFIVANEIEITFYYGGENIDTILGGAKPPEK